MSNGHEQEEIELAGLADYEVGFKARLYGEPFDTEGKALWWKMGVAYVL